MPGYLITLQRPQATKHACMPGYLITLQKPQARGRNECGEAWFWCRLVWERNECGEAWPEIHKARLYFGLYKLGVLLFSYLVILTTTSNQVNMHAWLIDYFAKAPSNQVITHAELLGYEFPLLGRRQTNQPNTNHPLDYLVTWLLGGLTQPSLSTLREPQAHLRTPKAKVV